jgi:protein TonB
MNIDDLLFKFRNKAYGAYYLRRKYTKTLLISLFISVLLALLVFVLPLFLNLRKQMKNEFVIKVEITPADLSLIENMLDEEPKVEKPKAKKVELKIDEKLEIPSVTNSDSANISEFKKDSLLKAESLLNKDKNIDPRLKSKAEFSCSEDLSSFRSWFINNFKHDQKQKKITGKLILQFSLNTSGIIDSVIVVQGLDKEFDNEAKKLLLQSPRWSPCMIGNKKVKMRFNLPIYIISW